LSHNAETAAPFAMSVHFKDIAVQPADDGFRLSEVPLGTGALDLPRIPCLTAGYFATFPERKAARLDAMMYWVKANPPKQAVPVVIGKPFAQVLAEEEANNRACLGWMRKNISR